MVFKSSSKPLSNGDLTESEVLSVTLVSFSVTGGILMSLAKTRKVGGSLVVTLPKELVESEKIKEGEKQEHGCVCHQPRRDEATERNSY